MGLTKTENFTEWQNRMAKVAKALGHPARIAIIEFLIKKKVCICGDIVQELPLSQSTVSQHLKELKEAGLIKGDIEGTSVCYCIDGKTWKEVQQAMTGLFASYNPETDSCC